MRGAPGQRRGRAPLLSSGMRALLARRGAPEPDADAGAGSGEHGTASAGGEHPAAARADRITWATRVAAVVAAIGLVAVVVFGVMWWVATHGSAAQTAAGRDEALAAARQIAVNLETLDYNTVDKGLDTWEASTTGPLLEEFKKNRQQYADQMRAVQTTTNARLVDAALSDLDLAAGKAKAVASVDVTTTKTVNGAPSLPTTRQVRMQLSLVRTPDAGWKADAASAL
jgi:Mce-associated membrane protein